MWNTNGDKQRGNKTKVQEDILAKYNKQRSHQSLRSLSSNVMALRAGCDDKWSVYRQAQK
jgi:hypothetical protein